MNKSSAPHYGLSLPYRTEKPRKQGLTSLHDINTTIGGLRQILEDYGSFIDIAKIGVGTALVTPRLKEKISLYHEHDIAVYFGGTLFEKFYQNNLIVEYRRLMEEFNIDWVEISCGTIDIPLATRKQIVTEFNTDFTVVAEVGSKDSASIMPPSQWMEEIDELLSSGAEYVVTEGRNSGTAGVFRPTGEIRTGLVSDIISTFGPEPLIFEAPTTDSQVFFINQVGPNVNLGNVSPVDVLLLETQRLGLRSETFHLK